GAAEGGLPLGAVVLQLRAEHASLRAAQPDGAGPGGQAVNPVWSFQLLGGFRARHEERTLSRFRTQKTAALLAYLSYHRHRSHPRETLVNLCWPEADPDSARHSLSLALSSLRSQLEPPGVPAGAVIVADRW